MASPVFLVTQFSIALGGVVYLLVFALPSLALLALVHRLTQELLAPASVWTRPVVVLLTLSTRVAVQTTKSALGLLSAKLLIVTAEGQAMFVSLLETSLRIVQAYKFVLHMGSRQSTVVQSFCK
jgi:hypothetical protein